MCIVAGEVLQVSEPFLTQNMHPTVIISAYRQALEDMQDILRDQVRSAAAALYIVYIFT